MCDCNFSPVESLLQGCFIKNDCYKLEFNATLIYNCNSNLIGTSNLCFNTWLKMSIKGGLLWSRK